MAVNNKFKPKVSNNIIEGATPVEETDVKIPESGETETTDTNAEVGAKVPTNGLNTAEEADKTTADEEVNDEEGATPVEETLPTEDVVEENSDGSDTKDENPDTAPPEIKESPITFEDKDSESSPIEKNVKVCLNVNHSCNIGGVSYHFERGKQINVPTSVKTILMQAGLLMPL